MPTNPFLRKIKLSAKSNKVIYVWHKQLLKIGGRQNWFQKSTTFLIDGYPRSGNTYLHMLIKNVFRGADFVHHFHAVGAVKVALSKNIPCFILYRDPKDAIASYYLFEHAPRITNMDTFVPNNTRLIHYLKYYKTYYKYILENKDRLLLISFDRLINNPEKVMVCINEAVPEQNRRSEGEIKGAVTKAKNRIKGPTDTLVSNRPNEIKEMLKKRLFQSLEGLEDFQRANELYEELRKAKSNI